MDINKTLWRIYRSPEKNCRCTLCYCCIAMGPGNIYARKGAAFRAQQVATLSEMSHELFTRESFKNILQDLQSADGLDEQQKNVALSWYDYTQQDKLPGEFVRAQ